MRPWPGKFNTQSPGSSKGREDRGARTGAEALLAAAEQGGRIERDLPADRSDRPQGRDRDPIDLDLDTAGIAGQERQAGLIRHTVNIAAAQNPGQKQGILAVPDLDPAILGGAQDDARGLVAFAIDLWRSLA